MGKAARARRAKLRTQKKRSAKIQKAALYKSYSEQGRMKRLKRAGRTGDEVFSSGCLSGGCGNIGCFKCAPGFHNLPPLYVRKMRVKRMKLNDAILLARQEKYPLQG